MTSLRPTDARSVNTPAFLARIRARQKPSMPRWLDWNLALLGLMMLGFGGVLWLLSPILAPFLAAAILAYIFDPLVDRLQARGISRSIGTVIAVLLLLLGIVLLFVIVVPLFYKEIQQLTEEFPGFVEKLKTTAIPWINEKAGLTLSLDSSSFRQFISDNMSDAS